MKNLFLAIFCLLSIAAQAAAPTPSCSTSITNADTALVRTAPVTVFLDCTDTTGVTMQTGFFQHSFGDTNPGNWSYGANTAINKNQAFGIVAAHVYETAGSYTITSKVCNSSGECAQTTNSITIVAANTTWATTKTKCVSGTGVFTGCPSGASQVTNSNATTAVSDNIGSGDVRILFRGGETFTAGSTLAVNQAGGMLGSYGTGNAIISGASAITVTAANWRISGLTLSGGNSATYPITVQSGASKVLIVGNTVAGYYGFVEGGDAADKNDVSVVGNAVTNGTHASSGEGIALYGARQVAMGNSINGDGKGNHFFRGHFVNKGVVSNNTFTNNLTAVEAVTVRAKTYSTAADISKHVIISDNRVTCYGSSCITAKPSSAAEERVEDVTIERNFADFPSSGGAPAGSFVGITSGVRIAVQNNLVNGTYGDGAFVLVSIDKQAASPSPSDNLIYNNTIYRSDAVTNFAIADYGNGAGSTNTVAKNNLAYVPLATNTTIVNNITGDGNSESNNSSAVQMKTTDPDFDGPLTSPVGFRITTASPYQNAGTAGFPASNSDFFNCDDNTANEHIGAFVPRVRAQCRGVAGP